LTENIQKNYFKLLKQKIISKKKTFSALNLSLRLLFPLKQEEDETFCPRATQLEHTKNPNQVNCNE